MAVLDVQFSRGTLCYGHSTSYDSDEEMVVPALHAVACLLRHDTGEPTEPLVGTVRKPARFLEALELEADGFEASAFHRLGIGSAFIPAGQGPHLLVVLQGQAELRVGDEVLELGAGALALLPADSGESVRAASALELLAYPIG